jgi:predicted Ser/Thr protein kinase
MSEPSAVPPQIGPYRIVEKIGEGGMGAVYKAIDTRLDRTVALKVLTGRSGNAREDRRFAREAKAASALNHPNIVTIYEFERHDGLDFIAMEYVRGESLKAVLEARAAPPARLLDYARQAARAVAAAHAAGIVHRDLKPANLMVTGDGVVKVLDFGLALLAPGGSAPDATRTQITMVGTSIGTPQYMSPEQAKGEDEDWRSDIFSFGVVLYEMMCGKRPFDGRNAQAAMWQVVNETPAAPSRVNPAVPPALEKLILRCLEKNPERRPQSMEEVAAALAAIPEQSSRSGRPLRRAALAGVLVLIAGGGVAYWMRGRAAPPPPALAYRLEVQKMADQQPLAEPYTASTDETFETGWRFRLHARPSRAGYLYLIGDDFATRFEMTTGWYVFDEHPGTDVLWLVWSERPWEMVEKTLTAGGSTGVRSLHTDTELQRMLEAAKGTRKTPDAPGWLEVELHGIGAILADELQLKHR